MTMYGLKVDPLDGLIYGLAAIGLFKVLCFALKVRVGSPRGN